MLDSVILGNLRIWEDLEDLQDPPPHDEEDAEGSIKKASKS